MDMMFEEKRLVIDRGNTEMYRAIGRFVVMFEHTCHDFRNAVSSLKTGMISADVMKKLDKLTAGNLRVELEDLLSCLNSQVRGSWEKETERDVVKTALEDFEKLTKFRNKLLHNSWHLDFGALTGEGGAPFTGPMGQFTTAEIDEKSDEAERLQRIFGSLASSNIHVEAAS